MACGDTTAFHTRREGFQHCIPFLCHGGKISLSKVPWIQPNVWSLPKSGILWLQKVPQPHCHRCHPIINFVSSDMVLVEDRRRKMPSAFLASIWSMTRFSWFCHQHIFIKQVSLWNNHYNLLDCCPNHKSTWKMTGSLVLVRLPNPDGFVPDNRQGGTSSQLEIQVWRHKHFSVLALDCLFDIHSISAGASSHTHKTATYRKDIKLLIWLKESREPMPWSLCRYQLIKWKIRRYFVKTENDEPVRPHFIRILFCTCISSRWKATNR